MEKYYCFAGIEIAIQIPDQWMYEQDGTLTPFRVEAVEDPHRYCFSVVQEQPLPAGREIAFYPNFRVFDRGDAVERYIGLARKDLKCADIRVLHRGKLHEVQLCAPQFRGKIGIKTVLNVLGAEHLMVENHGFILHASCIEHEGRAILFTAPSETGKSTQAELWKQLRGARIINGDRIAVNMADGQAMASGIPFSGSSTYCLNRTLPLAAVVYLQQAPETTIRQLDGFRAFRQIWEGISMNTWDENDVNLAMDTLQQLLEQVPVYHLACRKDESAVIALEQALKKEGV